MRLGQLARKLDIKKTEIQQIVKEQFKIELGDHPNTKVQDEYVDFITEKFNSVNTDAIADDKVVENKAVVKPEIENTEKEIVSKEKVTNRTTEENPKSEEVSVPINLDNVEHIETQKAKNLNGPTIIGKIEVPELAPDLVEVDGVMVDRNELKEQEKKKKKLEREAKQKARELAKLKHEAKKLAFEAGEKISSDKEIRERERKEAERIKKQAEYEKKKKKERYDKIKAANQAAPKLNKKQKKKVKVKEEVKIEQETHQKVEAVQISEPKGSVFTRFWRWLTTD